MTDIIILRAESTEDAAGDRVEGDFVDHLSLSGKVAPSNREESVEVGRNAVITQATVYVRDLPAPPDIRHTDQARIRGKTYSIEGEVGLWEREDSGTWAVQFAVKWVGG